MLKNHSSFWPIVLTGMVLAVGCKSKNKSGTPGRPERPTDLKAFSLVEWTYSRCSPTQPLLDGTAVLIDVQDENHPKPVCLGTAIDDSHVATTQGCSLPSSPAHTVVSVIENGSWVTYEVAELAKHPFEIVNSWIAKPGSIDFMTLKTKAPMKIQASLIDKDLEGRRFSIKLYYLNSNAFECPDVKSETFTDLPFLYNFGTPLNIKGVEYSPDLFVGGSGLDCRIANPGTLMSLIANSGSPTPEKYIGIYSRPYKFYSGRCEDRGDEIFVNLRTALIERGSVNL